MNEKELHKMKIAIENLTKSSKAFEFSFGEEWENLRCFMTHLTPIEESEKLKARLEKLEERIDKLESWGI